MNLVAKYHRWRLAKTEYWLPYEEQIHELLTSDFRLADLRDILQTQIATLYEAYRSRDSKTLNAKYAYRTTKFYDVSDEFKLCDIQALNASGSVHFGGGMLSEIRITPEEDVNNPKVFRILDASLADVTIPEYVPSPHATGWVAELEDKGILIRKGVPKDGNMPAADCPTYQQYNDLFNQCAAAAIQLHSELFYFYPPPLCPVEDRRIGDWIPLLDLRELGGLAITREKDGYVTVSYMVDGYIEWTEPDVISAIEFVHAKFGK